MAFDGDAISYEDLKNMDMAEYCECVAAKELFIKALEEQRKKK